MRQIRLQPTAERIALFENEPARKVSNVRSGCGDIVDRTAYRQPADIASGKELGRHDEAVGRERDAARGGKLGDARVVSD